MPFPPQNSATPREEEKESDLKRESERERKDEGKNEKNQRG